MGLFEEERTNPAQVSLERGTLELILIKEMGCPGHPPQVLICLYREHLVALHGSIKKTRATPEDDLAIARKRQRELASKSKEEK